MLEPFHVLPDGNFERIFRLEIKVLEEDFTLIIKPLSLYIVFSEIEMHLLEGLHHLHELINDVVRW